MKAVSAVGTSFGVDQAFAAKSNIATLAGLNLSAGTLSPGFASGTLSYNAGSTTSTTLIVTPTATHAQAGITVNGTPVTSGTATSPIILSLGTNTITIVVTSSDNTTTQTYTVSLNRSATLAVNYNAASDVPETVSHYTATGNTVNLTLNYAPTAGTNLTVIKNTGLGFINGAFSNLAQGQTVTLSFGGISYSFIATYFGGSGNDLVLQWANTRALAWGRNGDGQLGNNSTTQSNVPVAVTATGVLTGKTITSARSGDFHSVALCADGTVATWGYAFNGQLGNNSTTQSSVPGGIYTSGVLAGKTVIAIAAGTTHTLVLCSDATLAAWGSNISGQLGNATNTSISSPVLVNTTGVLAGKTVIAIATGSFHSLALCSDGTLASWGFNSNGELGNNSIASSNVPVLVSNTGVLAGKTVSAIAAGSNHSLVLCSDGTLAAWGFGGVGELGNNSALTNLVPVLVTTSGVLAGKTVVAIASGGDHNLALCSDGTLVSWGYNINGQLGNSSTTNSGVPVAVNITGALAGKTVVSLGAGDLHSLALCSDGTLVSWGDNVVGELGNNATTQSNVPVFVNTSALQAGERFTVANAGTSALHNLAIVAAPPPAVVTTLAATSVTSTGATLNGTVNANGLSTTVSFDYGLTTAYGSSIAATPSTVTGSSVTAVSAALTSLPSAIYHFRVRAVNAAGTVLGNDLTFSLASPVQTWRQTYFGTTANTGNTADTADFDLDGTKNLIEYGFATDPTNGAMGSLIVNGGVITQHGGPVTVPNGAGFDAVFARRLDRVAAGLTYTVEFSANLNDWEASAASPAVIATDAEVDAVSVPFPALLVSGQRPQFFRVAVGIAP